MELLDLTFYVCLLHIAYFGAFVDGSSKVSTYYMTRDCKLPSKQNYMEKNQRELTVPLGGAVIFSHRKGEEKFPVNFVCMIVAHAAEEHKIHVNIKNVYIPTESDVCTNALYLYDSNTFLTKGMSQAGGDSGMCNKVHPKTLTTSTSYLTIVLRTVNTICRNCDSEEEPGIELILTSVQEPKKDSSVPGGRKCRQKGDFLCGGMEDNYCISSSLKCDGIPNCKDEADEDQTLAKCGNRVSAQEKARTNKDDNNLFSKIFSLGVSAAIAIVAGPILCLVVCIAGTICCCFRCSRARQKNEATATASAASAVSRTVPTASTAQGSAAGSATGDSVYVGGGFYPMRSVSASGTSMGGSERIDLGYPTSLKYQPVNGHYSTSSGGTASPFNYKKNAPPSLASSGYQALVYAGGCGSKSFCGTAAGGGPCTTESSLGHPVAIAHSAVSAPTTGSGGHGGYPSSVYSYQSSHSSAAAASGHPAPNYRDSLMSSGGGGRLHSPTSSRSGRSLRSSVTYHPYNPTPSLSNTEERIEYPVQL